MCFFVEENSIELIAEQDIPCYKVMKKAGWFGRVFKSPVYPAYGILGFHMYAKTEDNKHRIKSLSRYDVSKAGWYQDVINEGIHTYHDLNALRDDMIIGLDNAIIYCMIPKGAKYYKNRTQYVSTEIKLIKVLKNAGRERMRTI